MHAYLLLMVQIALASAQQHVIYVGLNLLHKRAIATHAELQVGAIVAHHIHLGSGQFVAVMLVHPTLDGLHNLGIIEAVDVVEPTQIATIGTEETLIKLALEGHAEIVGLGVQRVAWVMDGG